MQMALGDAIAVALLTRRGSPPPTSTRFIPRPVGTGSARPRLMHEGDAMPLAP
jgi:hypothetical protein